MEKVDSATNMSRQQNRYVLGLADIPGVVPHTQSTHLFSNEQTQQYLRMPMSPNIHLCKGTNITHSSHFNCEIPKEIYNLQRLVANFEHQKHWRYQRTQQFFKQVYLKQEFTILIER